MEKKNNFLEPPLCFCHDAFNKGPYVKRECGAKPQLPPQL
jgi:hypothetical protein